MKDTYALKESLNKTTLKKTKEKKNLLFSFSGFFVNAPFVHNEILVGKFHLFFAISLLHFYLRVINEDLLHRVLSKQHRTESTDDD